MKKYLIIKADTNDGDYITEKSEITDEQLIQIQPVIEQLQFRRNKLNENLDKNWNQWRHNWETFEYGRLGNPHKMYVKTGLLTEEQINLFGEFVPYGEYGIHTIESIELLEVVKETKLL